MNPNYYSYRLCIGVWQPIVIDQNHQVVELLNERTEMLKIIQQESLCQQSPSYHCTSGIMEAPPPLTKNRRESRTTDAGRRRCYHNWSGWAYRRQVSSLPILRHAYELTFLMHADICSLVTKTWPVSVSVPSWCLAETTLRFCPCCLM